MNAAPATAEAALNDKISNLDDDLLLACIDHLGGGSFGISGWPENIVRAKLLDEYEGRHGEDAVDKLLDQLGM